MSKKKLAIVIIFLGILLNVLVAVSPNNYAPSMVDMHLEISCDNNGIVQLFYSANGKFTEEGSLIFYYEGNGEPQCFDVQMSSEIYNIRLDFPDECKDVRILDFSFIKGENKLSLTQEKVKRAEKVKIKNVVWSDGQANIETLGKDAYLIFDDSDFVLDELVREQALKHCLMKKIGICILIDVILLIMIFTSDKFMVLPIELYHNRGMIWKLSKNDFKTRYAGSYLGIFWAFVQPIVTILVYWLVFDKGLNVGSTLVRTGIEVPFVLWLTAGLVPWFFFQEALMNGTNALLEYNYLVKKVVFKISILPIIKIVSALFVHLFFVIFVLVLFACYGYYPDIYTLQVFYYSICLFALVLALSYTTCSVVVFFRDLSQIINILLQIGVWATPIMWQISIIQNKWLKLFFKLNPLYYIVQGYRDALIEKEWFFNNIYMTIYFWAVVLVLFGIGTVIFKRLKVHFADVL